MLDHTHSLHWRQIVPLPDLVTDEAADANQTVNHAFLVYHSYFLTIQPRSTVYLVGIKSLIFSIVDDIGWIKFGLSSCSSFKIAIKRSV
jgi:hypothetical protein